MKKVKRENKEKIMEMIRKAGSEEYETSWNKAGVFSTSKKKSEVKKGKNSRAKGARFELNVRKDLENKGRIVDKWNNNVDLDEGAPLGVPQGGARTSSPSRSERRPQSTERRGKLIIAKRKYNPFSKVMTIGTGFPDFISIKQIHEGMYSVIGVEVKMNGILSKIEKEKCAWYLKNKIFSQIWIAKKGEKPGQIEYDDFAEKYGKKYNKI